MCHYAHVVWEKSNKKSWHLYGHSHGQLETTMDDNFPNRLSMDVGVDNVFQIFGEYRPISFEEIRAVFEKN